MGLVVDGVEVEGMDVDWEAEAAMDDVGVDVAPDDDDEAEDDEELYS